MLSTRDRFAAAIAQAATVNAAAGLCAAIHRAEIVEFLEEVWPMIASNDTGVFLNLMAQYLPAKEKHTA